MAGAEEGKKKTIAPIFKVELENVVEDWKTCGFIQVLVELSRAFGLAVKLIPPPDP